MTSTGRRGYVGIDRRWLEDPNLSDTAMRFMLWLDSHSDEYLAKMNITKSAERLGWGRNRVMRAVEELESLGLISTEKLDRRGGGTVTRFTLHLYEWSDGPRWRDAPRHDDATASRHGDAPTKSTPSSEESNRETPQPPSTGEVAERDELGVFFDHFWNAYPRKVGKPAAKKAMKSKYDAVARPFIIEGVRKWVTYWDQSGTNEQFIPHPATFLNQERYLDEPPKAVKKETPMSILKKIAERDHQ
jgi:hypothetical protein